MKILAIETSCDETSAAVLTNNDKSIQVLSNITATSLPIHASTGGIIPENAAREQLKFIIPVITEALLKASNTSSGDRSGGAPSTTRREIAIERGLSDGARDWQDPNDWKYAADILKNDIDAIAVTYGPGLIASLLVGVETAKTLSLIFDKPIIPVNHLLAHIYANLITPNPKSSILNRQSSITFPFIGFIVSGGHTDLLYFKSHKEYKWLGGTRDDAAGEAFDKIGRLLDLSYPAGPEIERRAKTIKNTDLKFQSPLIYSKDFDFSFSGLKAEVMRYVTKEKPNTTSGINQICYATQKAIIDVLVKKTLKAAKEYNCPTILVGGGVSANQAFCDELNLQTKTYNLQPTILFPEKKYSTDNAAMIGAYALLHPEEKKWQDVNANPELYFS